jgi:FemAB-related protein (PEP-CTERM system-associated)
MSFSPTIVRPLLPESSFADAELAHALSPKAADRSLGQLSVAQLAAGDERRWDEFVIASPDGSFFHLSGWKRVIEKAFGYQTSYLIARRDGVITGVLPLTHVISRLFGSRLVSNAFGMYGGPVASDDESRRALEDEAVRLMERLHAPSLEVRSITAHRTDWLSKADLYVTFRKPILPQVDANLKAISGKQRNIIRKALKNQLRSEVHQDVDHFYRVYSESVRNLGTPVFQKSYFEVLADNFKTVTDIVVINRSGKAVSAAFNIYFRDEVMPFYAGGTALAPALAGNVFMYWEVMRRACERGCRLYDFGRSKVGTGAYTFKHNWGFEATPLAYQYKLAEGQEIPDRSPLNPKYRLLIATWKKLPLPVSRILGPPIARGLG